MKKKLLAGLATGLLISAMGDVVQAIPMSYSIQNIGGLDGITSRSLSDLNPGTNELYL